MTGMACKQEFQECKKFIFAFAAKQRPEELQGLEISKDF